MDKSVVLQQNIFNYCMSGDLQSLRRHHSVLKKFVHTQSCDGQTCLIAACRNGHCQIVEYLIDHCGVDLEQVGIVEFDGDRIEGVTPLWCAAAVGDLKIVKALVSRGSNVNGATYTSSTALRAACFDGYENIVRYLVEHGADIEIANRHGHTCLMISCYRRYYEIVEFLLSQNARVNRRSAKGNTALHYCAEGNNATSLRMLLQQYAIPRRDEYGQSPILAAANAAAHKVVDYLTQLYEKPDCPIDRISVHEKAAAYELLGSSLFDLNSLVQDAITAWFRALQYRRDSIPLPKLCSSPQQPQCTCHESTTMDLSSDEPPEQTIWSLIRLSAREVVANMELLSARNNPSDIFGQPVEQVPYFCPSCVTCPKNVSTSTTSITSRDKITELDDPSVSALYARKQFILREQLELAYRKELECHDESLTEFSTLSPSQSGLFAAQSEKNCLQTAINFSHFSPITDPVLRSEPICCLPPRYRRLPFDTHERVINSHLPVVLDGIGQSLQQFGSQSVKCKTCGHWTVYMGYFCLPPGEDSLLLQCQACTGEDYSGDKNSGNSSVLNASPVALPPPIPSKLSFLPLAMDEHRLVCACCRLVSEDHPFLQRLRQRGDETFGRMHEFTTEDELEHIMRNSHALRFQPLLTRLRIMGPDHQEASYFIRYRGASFADSENLRQCLSLWLYALELQRVFLDPLCHAALSVFISLTELFNFILYNRHSGLYPSELDPTALVDCLQFAVDNIERGSDFSFFRWHRRHPWSYTTVDQEAVNFTRYVVLTLHITLMLLNRYFTDPMSVVCTRQPLRRYTYNTEYHESIHEHTQEVTQCSLPETLKQRFLTQVYRLVQLDPRVDHGQSLLHLACSADTSMIGRFPICSFPNLPVLKLMLFLGADPNCRDVHGRDPIGHVLNQRRLTSQRQGLLISTLVRGGAHLDAVDRNGLCLLNAEFQHVLTASGLKVLQHTSLACMAARAARQAGFSSQNCTGLLTQNLLQFLDMH